MRLFKFTTLLILTACSQSQVEDRAALDNIYARFSQAYSDLDADAVTDLYTDNAHYLSPGSAIRIGKDSIRAGFRRMFNRHAAARARLEIRFEIVDRSIVNTMAYDVGYYILQATYPDSSIEGRTSVGKFAVIAMKSRDGWKFHVDSYSNAPLTAVK